MAMSILAKEVEPRGISVVIFSPRWVQMDTGGANAALTHEQNIGGMRKALERIGVSQCLLDRSPQRLGRLQSCFNAKNSSPPEAAPRARKAMQSGLR
jgi:hypothetical protein